MHPYERESAAPQPRWGKEAVSYQPPPDDRDDAAGRQSPGWYLDPISQQALRWWDGVQWGQQTQPLPGRGQEPQTVYPQQPYGQHPRQPSFTPDRQYGMPQGHSSYQGNPQYPGTSYGQQPWPQAQSYGQQHEPPSGHHGRPPHKSWPRRHKVLTVLGGLVTLIIIGSIAAAAGGGSQASPSAPAAASTSPVAGGGAPVNTAPTASRIAKIGTPVRDGKFQFTVTSVSHAKSVGDTADGLGDTAQGEYTILHVTVTNIGSQPQTLDDSSQFVYDASGRKYDASTSADIDLNSASGSDSVFFNDINPGNTVRGELAFDMPAGLKAVKAELHDSAFSDGVTVNLS
jgi:hypothetical protein